MPKRTAAIGSLQRRIRMGLADPISDREREQLAQMRAIYVRRFGKAPVARFSTDITQEDQHGTAA